MIKFYDQKTKNQYDLILNNYRFLNTQGLLFEKHSYIMQNRII